MNMRCPFSLALRIPAAALSGMDPSISDVSVPSISKKAIFLPTKKFPFLIFFLFLSFFFLYLLSFFIILYHSLSFFIIPYRSLSFLFIPCLFLLFPYIYRHTPASFSLPWGAGYQPEHRTTLNFSENSLRAAERLTIRPAFRLIVHETDRITQRARECACCPSFCQSIKDFTFLSVILSLAPITPHNIGDSGSYLL